MTKAKLETTLKAALADLKNANLDITDLVAECDDLVVAHHALVVKIDELNTFRGLFSALGRKLCVWR